MTASEVLSPLHVDAVHRLMTVAEVSTIADVLHRPPTDDEPLMIVDAMHHLMTEDDIYHRNLAWLPTASSVSRRLGKHWLMTKLWIHKFTSSFFWKMDKHWINMNEHESENECEWYVQHEIRSSPSCTVRPTLCMTCMPGYTAHKRHVLHRIAGQNGTKCVWMCHDCDRKSILVVQLSIGVLSFYLVGELDDGNWWKQLWSQNCNFSELHMAWVTLLVQLFMRASTDTQIYIYIYQTFVCIYVYTYLWTDAKSVCMFSQVLKLLLWVLYSFVKSHDLGWGKSFLRVIAKLSAGAVWQRPIYVLLFFALPGFKVYIQLYYESLWYTILIMSVFCMDLRVVATYMFIWFSFLGVCPCGSGYSDDVRLKIIIPCFVMSHGVRRVSWACPFLSHTLITQGKRFVESRVLANNLKLLSACDVLKLDSDAMRHVGVKLCSCWEQMACSLLKFECRHSSSSNLQNEGALER